MNVVQKSMFIVSMLLATFLPLAAYQSFESLMEITLMGDLVDEIESALGKSEMMRNQTHCGTTAHWIIESLKEKEVLFEQDAFLGSFSEFSKTIDNTFNEAIAQQLFSCSKSHKLFWINVCAGGHVFVVEKKSDGKHAWWRIFQSWQKAFTLANWLDCEQWLAQSKIFKSEFLEYGRGIKITQEQLMRFIKNIVNECSPRLNQFRELGLGMPYELEIKMFQLTENY